MRLRHIALALAVLATSAARADTLTCQGGRIVQPEMSADAAISRCGQPNSKDVKFVETRAVNAEGNSIKTGETKVETWRYLRGSQKPAVVLVIKAGKIVSIDFE